MIPTQAQVQAPSHAQPLSQAATAGNPPGCDAVSQLQSQINSLQAQLFHLAVARQLALSPAEHYVCAPTLAEINAFRNKQVGRFEQVYKMLPDRIAEWLLNDVQQHVTRFIFSQLWEIEDLESFRCILAVESVISSWFPAIPSATSETTTDEPLSTCTVPYSLASSCSAEVPQIEAALPTSTAESCLSVPFDLSAVDVVTFTSLSCVGARSDPAACRAAGCLSPEGELVLSDCSAAGVVSAPRFSCVGERSGPDAISAAVAFPSKEGVSSSWTCRPARQRVGPRCDRRSHLHAARWAG